MNRRYYPRMTVNEQSAYCCAKFHSQKVGSSIIDITHTRLITSVDTR